MHDADSKLYSMLHMPTSAPPSESLGQRSRARLADAREALTTGAHDKVLALLAAPFPNETMRAVARRIEVLARAALGDAEGVIRCLRVAALSSDEMAAALAGALRRSWAERQHQAAVKLSAELATLRPLAREAAIAFAAARHCDQPELTEALARAQSLEDRAAFGVLAAVQQCDLPLAAAELESVSVTAELRPRLVRAVHDLARRHYDTALMSRLGPELLANEQASSRLPLLWRTFLASSAEGDLDTARRAFVRGETQVEAYSQDLQAWKSVASWLGGTFRTQEALAVIDRALAAGVAAPSSVYNVEQARAFASEFAPELDRSAQVMRALVMGRLPPLPRDERLRIVSRPKLINIENGKNAQTDLGWMRLVGEVIRQARSQGRSVTLLQSGLEALAAPFPIPLTLSYHTTGRRPAVLHFKESDLPTHYCVDEQGYSGWSSFSACRTDDPAVQNVSIEAAEEYHAAEYNRVVVGNISKYDQRGPSSEPLPERFVFVALQTLTDRVQALAHVSMLEMLHMVADAFCTGPIRVVAKRHPLCSDYRVSVALTRLSSAGRIHITDRSIHDLISQSDAVMTVNSGVGAEALLHLKPVYLFGASEISGAAHTVRSAEDLHRLTRPLRPVADDLSLKKYLFFYRNRWLVDTQEPRRLSRFVASRILGHAPA